MILQSKARPVRIRIKSGGEEHSSFESLKRHFCVKDLLPSAKDGRLSRWLRQQGEETVANSIDEQSNELPAAGDSASITEQAYLKFVLAFFDFEYSQISTKQALWEQWSATSYANCYECQNLGKEVAEAFVKEKKAKEDEKMKSSYSLALKKYKEEPDSRTKIEWMDIFSCFKTKMIEDVDYNWLMYEITSMEEYLEKSAELGHKIAKEILSPNRFENVSMQDFFTFFYLIKDYNIYYSNYLKDVLAFARKEIKVKKPIDICLKKDIIEILEAWNRFDSLERKFDDTWLNRIQILKPEASFICGVFEEYWKKSSQKYYEQYENSFELCKMRIDWMARKANICTICAASEAGVYRYMNLSRIDQTDSSYKKVADLVKFILLHIFDTYSYEIR